MKTFMLIGASRPNIPILMMAKEIGFVTIATDRNPKAAGLKIADISFVVGADETKELVKIALKHDVDCVYCGTDLNFSTAVIYNALGKQTFSAKVGLLSEYKDMYRTIAQRYYAPLTPGYIVTSAPQAVKVFDELGSDVVIKAINLCSSQGIIRVTDETDIQAAYTNCVFLSGEKTVIVEKYIEGTVHDFNGLVVDGEFHACGIVDRGFQHDTKHFIQDKTTCPTKLSVKVQNDMYFAMTKFCSDLGIVNSPVKGDFLYDGKNIYMLEFGPRFHGELGFLHIIPNAISVDAMRAYLKLNFTGRLDKSLLQEKVIDNAICRSEPSKDATSNYDIPRYTIDFDNRASISVEIA